MSEIRNEEIIEVYYEDGTRFFTKEEYENLYTLGDLKNSLCSFGFFVFENRGIILHTISLSSAFFSFHQPVQACQKNRIQSQTFVLEQEFDPNQSFQLFLQRTGNLKKKQNKLKSQQSQKNGGKSSFNLLTLAHFLASATNSKGVTNEIFPVPVPVRRIPSEIPPVFFPRNNLGGNVINIARNVIPTVNIARKIIPTGKLFLRGGFYSNDSILFVPILVGFLSIFDVLKTGKNAYDGIKNLKDILGEKDEQDFGTGKSQGRSRSKRKQEKGEGLDFWTLVEGSKNPVVFVIAGIAVYLFVKKNPDVLPASVTGPLGISRKRTWKEYFHTYIDFRTPKPYIILVCGGVVFFSYRNSSSILSFLKEKQPMSVLFEGIFGIANKQFDAYKEVVNNLYKSSSEVFKKTSDTNEKFFEKTLKDLEESRIQHIKIAEKVVSLTEKNAECHNALSISELANNYCAAKANEYGSQKFRLQLEKDAYSKIHNELLIKIREVSNKLISSSADSKALTIPGNNGNKLILQEYLQLLAEKATKHMEEVSATLENQKIPTMYEALPGVGDKKK